MSRLGEALTDETQCASLFLHYLDTKRKLYGVAFLGMIVGKT